MNEKLSKKSIPVAQAVGMVLPHDITEIDGTTFKGTAFKKGHIIQEKDVSHLKRLGKEHIYVFELTPEEIHENEAALLLADALTGVGVGYSTEVSEGKIELVALCDGILKINKDALYALNMSGEVICATLQSNTPVFKGDQVAATRLIPLISQRALVDKAVKAAKEASEPVVSVKQLRKARVGLVITGTEVYSGRIQDKFEPVLRKKLDQLGSEVLSVSFAPDDIEHIAAEIGKALDKGADLIVTSGGMSVDPDDVTRLGIQAAGAVNMEYGTPVLPGAMFMVAQIGEIPVLGLPACGMFHKITVFDLILPRILAGEKIGRKELAELGHGGLCRNCKVCQYPVCSFGK
ncbi:molybdopterin-binding protein [Desulfogranum japonicum]|uniref:molybdopterin-binding protein n=1 Tax=Desulfogranum japonicum TaxID=231447 RepID=UPI00048D3C9C|nr:molybdopterin-binding protein [Desulfogranum japonicum]